MSPVSATTTASAVNSVSAATPGSTSQSASIAVLKKALDAQSSSVTQLLQALPQPALATEGAVGTHVNTYA